MQILFKRSDYRHRNPESSGTNPLTLTSFSQAAGAPVMKPLFTATITHSVS